jgi:hypothetical protein
MTPATSQRGRSLVEMDTGSIRVNLKRRSGVLSRVPQLSPENV